MTTKTEGFIDTGSRRLHYRRFGNGPSVTLAFHGYGQSGGNFSIFAPRLSSGQTLIAFDLPNHGYSEWQLDEFWDLAAVKEFLENCRREFGAEKFILLGYSIGGRVCLKLAELHGEFFTRMVIAAPDGLKPNPFYSFVTSNFIGKKLFAGFLNSDFNPNQILDTMKKMKMIDQSKVQFLNYYISDLPARRLIFKRWMALKLLVPDLRALSRSQAAHGFEIVVFMGRHDPVIPLANVEELKRRATITLHILDKAHRVIDETTVPLIQRYLG